MDSDSHFMRLAIDEAEKAGPETWLNPRVGAVVVKDGRVLSSGHTHRFGSVHAERDAISKLSQKQLFNSILYVTLEPCNHYGKQPPCSQLIIDSHIKRVVVAQEDPHPIVAGKGIANLRSHGVDVTTGVLTEAAEEVNPHYNFYFQHQRPWITLKQAISLDDKVSAGKGQRTAITNDEVYRRVHRERANYHGIVIGSETALVDNPHLLTTVSTPYPPVRIVLDRRGRLGDHRNLHLLADHQAPTWVFTSNAKTKAKLAGLPVTVIVMGDCSIPAVVKEISRRGLQGLYVEGGPQIQNAFMRAGLVDELITYISPHIIGNKGVTGMQSPRPLDFAEVRTEVLGDNVRIRERK